MRHFLARPLLTIAICFAVAGIATSGLFLGGCSDARPEGAAAEGLSATSAKIQEAKREVNKTNGSLQKIKAGEDLVASYAKLKEQIIAVKSNAAAIKVSYEQMSAQNAAVVANWKTEIEAVQDPTLKASAAERSAKVTGAVAEITEATGKTKGVYQPFITTLDELTKFLDKDLSPGSAKVAGPTIEKCIKTGIDVQVELQMLSAKLDSLSGQIAPTAK